jgi:sugar lactone lactonase YvrE
VQSVVLDPLDRLWILDTGRALLPDGTLVNASPGGTKLVGVDITTGSVIKTIVFPPTVAYPDSYLNDVRFDLRSSYTGTGNGVAYITDSSSEGRNGLVIVDLGTGESWRHLDGIKETRAERGFVPYVWGQPLYYIPGPNEPLTTVPLGSDGIALSADGETLFFGPVGGRGLYSVPTARLRDRSQTSELQAQAAVSNNGERGVSDGFETDTNGFIYAGNMEQNEINFHNPANGTNTLFVRDPRIAWVDTSKFFAREMLIAESFTNVTQCLLEVMATCTSPTTSLPSLRRSFQAQTGGRGRLCCLGRLCREMGRGCSCSRRSVLSFQFLH